MDYVIETFSLSKTFSDIWGRDKVLAVDELELKVKENEVFGLLGPNGSGKTTTLKMLLGLLYPTKGTALLLGGDSTDPKINARIGFLPEESYLYRYLTARETLDFYGRLFSLPSKVRKSRTEALLDMVGLKAVANRPVGTFSKGMARRIGLAQALINDPDLLILDEPTTGLDPLGTRQIKDLIVKLKARGKSILLSSHLLADVEDVCDRIAILYGGKVQSEGQVRELLQEQGKTQIITDALSEPTIEKIKQLIQSENADCEISVPMEKLEAFFINTVNEAQRQARETSGAVTGRIGDFLESREGVAESRQESILDKLVSKPEKEKSDLSETRKATQPEPEKQPEADKAMLDQLTREESQQAKQQGDEKTRAPEPVERTERTGEPDKDVLDQLTGSEKEQHQEETTKKTDRNNQGDSADA